MIQPFELQFRATAYSCFLTASLRWRCVRLITADDSLAALRAYSMNTVIIMMVGTVDCSTVYIIYSIHLSILNTHTVSLRSTTTTSTNHHHITADADVIVSITSLFQLVVVMMQWWWLVDVVMMVSGHHNMTTWQHDNNKTASWHDSSTNRHYH
jgi:hypothetical protein